MAAPRGAGVSESDSFISEVTEEVRRERLFGYIRRYGWIAVLLVVLIVAGAAYREYQKASAAAAAQALGDQVLDALEIADGPARVAALETLPAGGTADALTALLTASEQQRAGDAAAAMATLNALAVNPDVDQMYRDLAQIKSLMLGADGMDPGERMVALQALSAPGAPYRLLALEQIALAQVTAADTDAALATLASIAEDAQVTSGQRDRVDALVVALGGNPPVDPTLDPAADSAATAPAQD